MPRVSTCLNFADNTEQVDEFYRAVFGAGFNRPTRRPGRQPEPEAVHGTA